ncbi:MAG: haloacid dehalogenase-like hydrolase [Bacilli bacterium]|mgnify:CR=1 FL=1|nr:haloacid dehalogenase-like hydrolase [Bacilli bacterium]
MKQQIVAIMYDFDKTLSTTDMQNYSFIPALGMTPEEFWGETGKFSEKTGVERILSYMYMMILKCREKNIKLTREFLRNCGKEILYHPGVETWFDRINKYGLEKNVIVEHYLVSSGTTEILEGCSIYKYFTKVYGCEFLYENDVPVWPKLAINYTQKTQFFFRIAKGVTEVSNDEGVNAKTDKQKLRIPYQNIVYLGDGMTDVACMTLVNKNNGHSIGVYTDKNEASVKQIKDDKRVTYIAKADYTEGSKMDRIMKYIIDEVSTNAMNQERESLLND